MNRRKFFQVWGTTPFAFSMERVAGVLLENRHLLQPSPVRDPLFHAVSRLSYGMTPPLYQYLQEVGMDAYLQEQLNPEAIDDSALDRQLHAFPLLDAPPYQLLDSATSRRDMVVNLFGGVVNRAWFSVHSVEVEVHDAEPSRVRHDLPAMNEARAEVLLLILVQARSLVLHDIVVGGE